MMISKGAALPLAILAASLLLLQPGEAQFGPGGGFFPPPGAGGFGNFMPPPGGFGSPFATMPNITCDQLNCAKGTCKMNSSSSRSGNSYNYSYSYSCQCENGWALPPLGVFLPFAPCALPNCTAATNCSDSVRPPPPTFTMPSNFSDPCSWAFCGGGDCVATSTYSYTCNCKAGFQNLFNSSVFPCYDDCSIGTECKKQGVGFLNATAGTPAVGGQGSSGGGSGSQGGANTAVPDSFLALLIIMLSLAMVIV